MRATHRHIAIGGIVAAVAYVTAVVAAMAGGHHRVRPLYEGVSPPAPYQWVNPPAGFSVGNSVPKAQSTVIALGPTGNAAVGVTSPDSQVIINLPAGAFAPHGTDPAVKSDIVPLDPAKLGSAAALGLAPDGNVYRIDLTYQPSADPVIQLAKPGDVILTVPVPAHAILFSPDGQAWRIEPTQQIGGGGFLGTTFKTPGYYMAGSQRISGTGAAKPAGSGSSNVPLIAGACAVLAGALFAGPLLWRRGRRPS